MFKKDYSYKTYIGNNYKPQVAYVENTIYKRSGNRPFNNTNNIHIHILTNIQLMCLITIRKIKHIM